MAKRTVRIPLYTKFPEKFIKLQKEIVEKHEALGVSSPLNNPAVIDMADYKQKAEEAEALWQEAEALYADYRAKLGQAKKLLGISVGQSINTEGTLYYLTDKIKKLLLVVNTGEEKNLQQFGFDVVTGTAKGVGRPRKS